MKSFDDLWEELSVKISNEETESHSALLAKSGPHEIGKKIVEEAAEVLMAAEHENSEALSLEISQLIYHLQVMAIVKGLSKEDIYKKL